MATDSDEVVFLTTDRLVLRRFTEHDVDLLVELDSDPEVMRFITGGRTTPRGEVERVILPAFLSYYERFEGYGFWAAIEKSSGGFIGWFHLRSRPETAIDEPELGYRLRASAWNKGYATEGSRALIHKAFTELGAERIVAGSMALNVGSRRVMEKAGLTLVRTVHDEGEDVVEYAVRKVDKSPPACG